MNQLDLLEAAKKTAETLRILYDNGELENSKVIRCLLDLENSLETMENFHKTIRSGHS